MAEAENRRKLLESIAKRAFATWLPTTEETIALELRAVHLELEALNEHLVALIRILRDRGQTERSGD